MEKRPKNWFVLILLGLSVLAFVGISLIPIVSSIFDQPDASTGQPIASQATTEQAKLEEEAKGYQLVLQREPTNETALKGLFETQARLVQLGAREAKDLIAPLTKLKDIDPEQTDYAVLLAQVQQQAGDREGSAQSYRQVLAKQPGNINALQGLATLFLAEQKSAAAIDLLKKTIEIAPQENQKVPDSINIPAVQLVLGDVYASTKEYEPALAIYDGLIQADVSDFRPLIGKALVLRAQGKVEQSKTLLIDASKLAPAEYKDNIKKLAEESSAPNTKTSPETSPNAPNPSIP